MKAAEDAIVVCANGNWLPYAGATLLSYVQTNRQAETAIYLIALKASPAQIDEIEKFLKQKCIPATVIASDLRSELTGIKAGRFSSATLLRLTLDHLLPPTIRRLLYLDSDLLVLDSIRELFEIDLQGKSVAATEDYISLAGPLSILRNHPRAIGMGHGAPYFNAGVILFDWQKVIKEKRLANCIAKLAASGRDERPVLTFLDQDALNLEFENDWTEFGAKYNFMTFKGHTDSSELKIRHFNSHHKPWGNVWIPGIGPYQQFYVDAFSGTSYASCAKKTFRSISVAELTEYVLRRTVLATGLRHSS